MTKRSRPTDSLSILADSRQFDLAADWLHGFCTANSIDSGCQHDLDICLVEALANVLRHGGPAARARPIELSLSAERPDTVRLTVTAGGIEFDPNAHVPRARPTSLEEAVPGGLGIVMMRNSADRIDYQRSGETNVTTFFRHRQPGGRAQS